MRVRKFNPLLYEKLKDAQGGGYFRALRASSSYTLKKKFLKNSKGKLYLSLFEKGHFCVGGVLNSKKQNLFGGFVFFLFPVSYLLSGKLENEGQSKREDHAGCVEYKRTETNVAIGKA